MDSVRNIKVAVRLMLAGAVCSCAFGLNPTLDINQYAHKVWTVREGVFNGSLYAITQTPDGYLWLGTEFGLERFDGVRSVRWQPPNAEHLPGGRIRSLLAARDGRLWIGTDEGLASWKDGKLSRYQELAGKFVLSILEDHEGTIWAAGFAEGSTGGRLCTIRAGRVECDENEGKLGNGIDGLFEDRGGKLWAGTVEGVWRWKPGPAKFFPMAIITSSFAEGDTGELLIATLDGIRKLVKDQPGPYLVAARGRQSRIGKLLRDRDGGLWVGTYDGGLLHVSGGRIDRFTHSDGLSGDNIRCLFEDREGSIWVGTRDGLDRFREFAVPALTEKQGLSNSYVGSILQARDGSMWLGTQSGLDRWKNGAVTVYGMREGIPDPYVLSLFEDEAGRIWLTTRRGLAYLEQGHFVPVPDLRSGSIVCMVGDGAGGMWIGDQLNLSHLKGQKVIEKIPWTKLGHKDFARTILHDPAGSGLWLGFSQGGVAYYKDGSIRFSYGRDQGLGEGLVSGLQLDPDGGIWAASGGGLSLIRGGRIFRLSSANGLPCDMVHWVLEDNDHFFWLYTSCGLVRVARSELEGWVADPKRTVSTTVLDNTDGVRNNLTPTDSNPMVAKSADGKIWFLPKDGVSVIDPRHLPFNTLAPPVHIEQIVAGDKPYEVRSGTRLPARVRDVVINYTALSLVAPEKIRFRYKLEGQDRDWHEVMDERQAKYTNLPPRKYRFRVRATNNSGVWNEAGDMLEFSIAPAYYQTNWFRALVAGLAVAFLAAAYQFRVWQVQRESRRLREVIETIPAYVWSALPDGFIDFINQRWLEFTGFSLTQALGWGWADAVHPEDRARLVEAWRAAVVSGNPVETEARMRSAGSDYRWQLIRGVPQRDQSGKIVRWYGQTTDIDDRKQAEEALRESETRFRTVLGHMADAIFVLDFEQGTIFDVNPEACESLGYSREELVGTTGVGFHLDSDQAALQVVAQRAAAGETVFDTHWHRRKDGTLFAVEVHTSLFWFAGRRFLLKVARDITERKRAEEERERLRQLEADLAHINRVSMMGELAASVAHEVNQPLAGIVSNGSAGLRFLANDTPDVEEAREALRDIVRDGKRAGEIIRRIRALTKRTELPRETLDLNETIREVLALVGDEAKKNSVTIRTQFADEVASVYGDRVQLQQVLLNLIMNAIQAMSSVNGRERQLVIIAGNADEQYVQVTVQDSGMGLDPDKIAKIFEPFYTTKSGGMGMGLSICRSILQNHGGRLWATANDGPGASFHFTLPKHQAEETKAGASAD